jgi:hypothetical protein
VHWPLPHRMAPQAFASPVHVAVHAPVVQETLPHADAPVQLALHAPPVQLMLPHAPDPPLHAAVQLPVVHEMLPHAPVPVQVAEQLPLVQPMSPHAPSPRHSTVHGRVPHVMPAHAPAAVQAMSHEAALEQPMAPQAPAVGQLIAQFQVDGHEIAPPVPVIVHVIVWKLHPPLQIAGHTGT